MSVHTFAEVELEGHLLERAIHRRPGYDCRGGCTPSCRHNPKNRDYGWSGDDYVCALRFDNVVGTLLFFTSWLDGRLVDRHYPGFRPADWSVCTSYPTEVEQLKSLSPGPCLYQRGGACYTYVTTALGAEALCKDFSDLLRFVDAPKAEDATAFLIAYDPLWQSMARSLLSAAEQAAADAKALPRLCAACGGTGVMP